MRQDVAARDVVVLQEYNTRCSGATKCRSVDNLWITLPGHCAPIARAIVEHQPYLRKPPKPKGGNPPFQKACLEFIFRQVRG